ncbi:MAG: Rieske 2Fe-2S domain-containing protein [Gemmataceae bacterium]|nr:Rieske 2Fe-2S domain-containing protein [Gemmataceae bacterium]
MSLSLREKLDLFDPDLPLERARTIPSLWYFDPEIHAAECRVVFGGTWQMAARRDQLIEPGSFVTTEIAGEPILVLRDEERILRAFINVCRHRAAPVVTEPAGQTTRLRCRYHGWTYDLTGRLRGVPEFEGVADFRREDNGLAGLAVDTWGSLVWVHPRPARQPLAAFLAPLPDRIAGLGLEALRWVARREYQLACNWKVFVDNYLDGGYHVNSVHPGLAGILDYAQYRTEIAGNTSVQISPLRPPETQSEAAAVGQVRTGATAYYWWIFPNLMINLYQGVMDTNLVLPLGPDRCRVLFDFYFAQTEGAAAERFISESSAVAHQIQLEDIGICEEVQRGLASRSFDTGRFSVKREAAGYHFHRLLAGRLRQPGTDAQG